MKWLLIPVLVLILWAAAVLGLQRGVLFPRHAMGPLPPLPADPPGSESWWLDTSQGAVEARFVPGAGVSPEQPGPLVVFAHGNAERIEYWLHSLEPYRQAGISTLLPEFRGYGASAGSPSQAAISADFQAFLGQALLRPEVDQERLLYHGRSMGGGAVCALASQRPPRAMLLQSSFTSVADMAWRAMLVPRLLVRDPFDNLATLRQLSCPVLVVHGRRDEVIPYSHGQALADAAARGRLHTVDCGHNDMAMDAAFWSELWGFLREAGVLPASQQPR